MRKIRKGDDAVVLTNRDDIEGDFVGKTGRVLAVQMWTGHLLLKFKGRACPISFPRDFVEPA